MKTLRSLIAAAAVLFASHAAMADGLMKLKTVEKRGAVNERLPGGGRDVRAAIGTSLSRSMGGSTGTFLPYRGQTRMNATRTGFIIHLDSGRYFDARSNKTFDVKPIPAH
jgi:hypothetical protein